MSLAQHVVVVSVQRAADAQLISLVESEGYVVSEAASASDVLDTLRASGSAGSAVLFNAGSVAEVQPVVEGAADEEASMKLLVCAPNGRVDLPTWLEERSESGRLLSVSGDDEPSVVADKVRHFLRGEGYRWGRDMAVTVSRDVPLLSGATGLRRQRDESADKLLEFVNELSRHTEADTMLQDALRKYLELLHCDAGSIYVWEDRTETLILKAAEGPEPDKRLGLRQKLGEGFAGWVAKVRDSILVTDARKVHQMSGRTCRRYSSFSCMGTPVMHGEKLMGVVCLTMTTDDRVFGPHDLLLAQSLSQKLASLVRPLTLLSELRSFNQRLLEVMEGCSEWLVEKNTQMEAMRALSSDIMDGIPIGVIAYDRRLRLCFSNVAAQVFLGEQSVVATGQMHTPLEEVLELDRREWRAKLLSVVEDAEEFRLQRVPYRAGSQERILDIHCSPLHDSGGSTIAGILTVQDVTEDVEMEAKLSSAERLALVGKIAAKVAHELNNPLDGILRFLGLAVRLMEAKPERARDYLEESRRGLLRMSNILTQLLVFSRSYRASGRPVSLSQIIRDSVALYEKRAEASNIEVHLNMPPDLPTCPDTELYQVFGNVIKNGLDAIGQDGVLTVSAVPEGGRVVVTVADTGPGVPADIKDKILEPFFTTKKDGTGTGLGLAACVDSLNRVGGSIRLMPSAEGAAFEIVVPVDARKES